MNRQCNRTGCGAPATASLSFAYEEQAAWLVDATEPHPATYGLCAHHADALRVPVGWTLRDERGAASLLGTAQAS
jgi:hypothetical protein